MPAPTLTDIARLALLEDAVARDVTTTSLEQFLTSRSDGLPARLKFKVISKAVGVSAGRAWAEAVAEAAVGLVSASAPGAAPVESEILPPLRLLDLLPEGSALEPGRTLLTGDGSAAAVLALERTLLNGLQYACGVATLTREFRAAIDRAWRGSGPAPALHHTRKTPPALRALALAGVEAGGGRPHRKDLADRILFKENHKHFVYAAGFRLADYLAYLDTWGWREEAMIEVETAEEAVEAVRAGAKSLLLDNFTPEGVRACLAQLPREGVEIEVSGGMSLEHVGEYALPGVTRISVGALTRDVRTLDLSLDWEPA